MATEFSSEKLLSAEKMRSAVIANVQAGFIAQQEMDMQNKQNIFNNTLKSRELTLKEEMFAREAKPAMDAGLLLQYEKLRFQKEMAQLKVNEATKKNRNDAINTQAGLMTFDQDADELIQRGNAVDGMRQAAQNEDIQSGYEMPDASEGILPGVDIPTGEGDGEAGPSLFDDGTDLPPLPALDPLDSTLQEMTGEGSGQGDSSTDAFDQANPDSFTLEPGARPTQRADEGRPSVGATSKPDWSSDATVDQLLKRAAQVRTNLIEGNVLSSADAAKDEAKYIRDTLITKLGGTKTSYGTYEFSPNASPKGIALFKAREEAIDKLANKADGEENPAMLEKHLQMLGFLGLSEADIAIKLSEAAGRSAIVDDNKKRAQQLEPIIKLQEDQLRLVNDEISLLEKTAAGNDPDMTGAYIKAQMSIANSPYKVLQDRKRQLLEKLTIKQQALENLYDPKVYDTKEDLGQQILKNSGR